MTSATAGAEGEEDQMARSTVSREQLIEEVKNEERSLMEKGKRIGPRTDSWGTLR